MTAQQIAAQFTQHSGVERGVQVDSSVFGVQINIVGTAFTQASADWFITS